MKLSALKYQILTIAASLATIILYLMPMHAFLTIWLASLTGHYTAWRLWKECLLAVIVVAVFYLLCTDLKIRSHTLTRRFVWTIAAYGAVQLVWGIVAFHVHDVTRKALLYGWLLDMRFLVFFLVVWVIALRTSRLRAQWARFIVWPALVVVVFGLLQIFVLPHTFLSHFGYGPNTILPYETINHNQNYIRIMSTLRGANPLGAYLLIPLSYTMLQIARGRRRWQWWLFLAAQLVVLLFSFSRSAWIGAILCALVVAGTQIPKKVLLSKQSAAAGLLVIVVLSGVAVGLRHNTHFQNIFLHTQDHSAVKTTSDAGHASALRSGIHDVVHQPLGKGPGSAGPASVYNDHPARIAENYFVQVGQETGWVGLVLFLMITVGIGYLLWLKRDDPLALTLLVSLVGITFVNVLSHAWSDDTLAYVWWGLAGIAMVPVALEPVVTDSTASTTASKKTAARKKVA